MYYSPDCNYQFGASRAIAPRKFIGYQNVYMIWSRPNISYISTAFRKLLSITGSFSNSTHLYISHYADELRLTFVRFICLTPLTCPYCILSHLHTLYSWFISLFFYSNFKTSLYTVHLDNLLSLFLISFGNV